MRRADTWEDSVSSARGRVEPQGAVRLKPDDGGSRAIGEYRAAQAVLADTPASHVNLALLDQRLGDAAAAEQSYLTALRIGDYFVPAYAGLAELYAQQNRDGDGAALLHRGLERVPDSADLHFALGMLLERQKQSAESLPELAAAARLAAMLPSPRSYNPRSDTLYLRERSADILSHMHHARVP